MEPQTDQKNHQGTQMAGYMESFLSQSGEATSLLEGLKNCPRGSSDTIVASLFRLVLDLQGRN